MSKLVLIFKSFSNKFGVRTAIVRGALVLSAIILSFSMSSSMFAAQTAAQNDQSTSAQNPENSTLHNQPMQRFDLKVYTGYIRKLGGKYMLLTHGSLMYKLDDQKDAQKLSGQDVAVTGTLNPKTNMIHVKSIANANHPKS